MSGNAIIRLVGFVRTDSGRWTKFGHSCYSTMILQRSSLFANSRRFSSSDDSQRIVQSLMNTDLSNKIRRDTLVYEIKSNSHLWRIHLLSIATFFFAVYFTIFLGYIGKTYGTKVTTIDLNQSLGYQFLSRFAAFVGNHWLAVSIAVIVFAFIEIGICSMFISRHVHSIRLLQGGRQVQLKLFFPIPNERMLRSVTIPLADIRALNSRNQPGQYLSLVRRNNRLSWVIDKDGHFPFPALFDTTVGLNRSFVTKSTKS